MAPETRHISEAAEEMTALGGTLEGAGKSPGSPRCVALKPLLLPFPTLGSWALLNCQAPPLPERSRQSLLCRII